MLQIFYALPLKLLTPFLLQIGCNPARTRNIKRRSATFIACAAKVISNLTGKSICHPFADKITVVAKIIIISFVANKLQMLTARSTVLVRTVEYKTRVDAATIGWEDMCFIEVWSISLYCSDYITHKLFLRIVFRAFFLILYFSNNSDYEYNDSSIKKYYQCSGQKSVHNNPPVSFVIA